MEAKEIISRLHGQWLVAKEHLRARCASDNMPEMAGKLAACDMFKGTEDLAEICRLFASPQGVEFCIATNFPNLATLRLFKPYKPERYGVYIDAGNLILRNPGTAILIGRSSATVECDTLARHTIVTMHGAAATINASGWAVVSAISGKSSNIIRRISDNAIII